VGAFHLDLYLPMPILRVESRLLSLSQKARAPAPKARLSPTDPTQSALTYPYPLGRNFSGRARDRLTPEVPKSMQIGIIGTAKSLSCRALSNK
jgi:hypothetical protein